MGEARTNVPSITAASLMRAHPAGSEVREAPHPGIVELHSTPPAARPAEEDPCKSSIPGMPTFRDDRRRSLWPVA
jgi:hypothetical protein